MFITRASPHLLRTRRIDPDYYAPVHVADEEHLRQFGSFELGDCGRFFVGPFGSELPSSLYRSSGVPLLRVGNVGQLDMSEDNLVFLDEATHRELRASEVLPGDLLIVKASVGEKICRFPSRYNRGNITQHIIGIRPNAYADMDYVAVALFSPIGRRQLERRSLGSIIQYLGVVDARTVLIAKITPEAQRYIGDKVRQAERLRARARRLEAEFRSSVAVEIPSATADNKTSRVGTVELGRNLNPGAHTPDRRAVRAAIRGAGGRSLDTVADIESPTADSYPPTAPYVGLDAIDSATCELKPSTATTEAVAGTSRLLREGPALSRLRPYLNKVTYIPPTLADGIGSTELLLVRPKAGVDGWFLYGVLKLESSVRQLNPVASGSTHPRVDREDVLDLLVPWLDEQELLGAKLRLAQACYFASSALTATATTLVEHLIDGRITEVGLIAAQQTFEAGDRDADREILKAIRQSDAPDAKPLIADVDALYALLDSLEGQDA